MRSRNAADGSRHSAPSTPSFINLFGDIRRDSQDTANLWTLRDLFVTASGEPPCVVDGLFLRDALVLVPASSATSATILQLTHTTGHDGPQTTQMTLQSLCSDFFVDVDKRLVRAFIRSCATSARNQTEALHNGGLL